MDGRERASKPAMMTDNYFMERSENTVIYSKAEDKRSLKFNVIYSVDGRVRYSGGPRRLVELGVNPPSSVNKSAKGINLSDLSSWGEVFL